MTGMRITGWGTALLEKIITNADLKAQLDTTQRWIVERRGLHERGGRLSPSGPLLLSGFGAGMTSASAVPRWDD